MSKSYDLIIIGAGPGGYVAAIRAAQLGLKVAAIDKRTTPGGTCLHVGCIPSKALLESSEIYEGAKKKYKRHGVEFEGVSLNLPNMLKRKDGVVKGLTQGVLGLMKKNKIDYYVGSGKFKSTTEVEIDLDSGEKETISGNKILIATGSAPIELPFLKFDDQVIASSTEALDFNEVPEHLVLIGGGVIGLELGSVWCRLGSKVTVVELLPKILGEMDSECSDEMMKILKRQGLKFMLNTKLSEGKVENGKATLKVEKEDGSTEELIADKVLVAVGRRPFTDNLGLEAVGVELDERRRVKIDEHFKTNIDNIYAIGDVVAGPMLAHKAEEEGVACAEIIAGKPGHINYHTIPGVVYTWPEVASVGYTEEQVRERGIGYSVGKFPFTANGKAKAMEEKEGFCKVIAAEEDDTLLGIHIVGPRASDLIAEAVAVMEFGGTAEDIARITHAHPTLSEALKEAALSADGRVIHM